MKRFPILLVVALLGAAVSAPAQRANNSRQNRGTVATSQQSQRGQVVNRAAPSRSVRSANSARRGNSARASSSSRGSAASRSVRQVSRTTPVRSTRSSQVGYVGSNGRGNRSSIGRIARNLGRIARSIPVPAPVGIHFGRGHDHGHYVTRCEQVLVPGYWDVEYHPAVYGWVYDSCGHRVWGVTEPAHDHRVWVPARYETRSRQVWVRH